MKLILIFTILLSNPILADTLPNTGLKQNEYGYYGEGVTFGGLPIVGEWRLSPNSETITVFDNNGTTGTGKWGDILYGVTENATELTIEYAGTLDKYLIITRGNNGCFYCKHNSIFGEIGGTNTYYETICKTQINNKTYGTNSKHVSVTVGSGE